MSKKKNNQEIELVATLPVEESPEVAEPTQTKAVVDGVWLVDGRMALCETEEQAVTMYEACFNNLPTEVTPAGRYPTPGERVLYINGAVPMYGRPD